MTYEQKKQIRDLQYQGFGYKKIAAVVGLSVNTVKSYCRVHPVDLTVGSCLQCGEPLIQLPNRKKKRFCSDKCRNVWWSAHPEARKPKTLYHHVCGFCGCKFDSLRVTSKYCSRSCLSDARRTEAE